MRLALALLVLSVPSHAAKKKKPAPQPTYYKGHGYVFNLPNKGKGIQTHVREEDEGEAVLVFKKGAKLNAMIEASPADYGKLGLIKVQATPVKADETSTIDSIEKQFRDDLTESGETYKVTRLTVLAMPGLYVRVESPDAFVQFALKGKSTVYYVTAGLNDPNVLDVVRSLTEGSAPPQQAGGQESASDDLFGGKKLDLSIKESGKHKSY